MTDWLDQLRQALADRAAHALRRQRVEVRGDGKYITRNGRTLLNFSSNDYLALSQHGRLKAAAIEATQAFGVGSGASQLVSGHLEITRAAEQAFARFKKADAALLFPTGYMANLAVLGTLTQPGDLVCVDKLNHASLIDAAKAAAGDMRVYPHRNLDKLARLLERHARSSAGRRWIVTDAVFSMDGDVADLPVICDLAKTYDAIVIVDEAHGTGVLGKNGTGLCEAQEIAAGTGGRSDVDIITVSTASKAMGGLGGLVTAADPVIDTLVNHARSFIYTTAVPPAQAAAVMAAVDVIEQAPDRREHLHALSLRCREGLASLAKPVEKPSADLEAEHGAGRFSVLPIDDIAARWSIATPIVPLLVGDATLAVSLAAHLERAGFFAPAIRPPTVAVGSARVRLSLRADMDFSDIDALIAAVAAW